MIAIREIRLEKVNEYHLNGKISDEMLKSAYGRLLVLERAITDVEKASGIGYPPVFIEPVLKKVSYPTQDISYTVIYASWNLRDLEGGIKLCVDISLPFLLYAPDEVLRACVAHEFLHYIFITIAIHNKQFDKLLAEDNNDRETHIIFDETQTVSADEWLCNEELKGLVKKVFSPLIKEQKLEDAIERWDKSGLPSMIISAGENRVHIPILQYDKIPLDSTILQRVHPKPAANAQTGQIF